MKKGIPIVFACIGLVFLTIGFLHRGEGTPANVHYAAAATWLIAAAVTARKRRDRAKLPPPPSSPREPSR